MSKLIIAAHVAIVLYVLGCTFYVNLPEWCAHPERTSNWVVQPLCK